MSRNHRRPLGTAVADQTGGRLCCSVLSAQRVLKVPRKSTRAVLTGNSLGSKWGRLRLPRHWPAVKTATGYGVLGCSVRTTNARRQRTGGSDGCPRSTCTSFCSSGWLRRPKPWPMRVVLSSTASYKLESAAKLHQSVSPACRKYLHRQCFLRHMWDVTHPVTPFGERRDAVPCGCLPPSIV